MLHSIEHLKAELISTFRSRSTLRFETEKIKLNVILLNMLLHKNQEMKSKLKRMLPTRVLSSSYQLTTYQMFVH